MYKRTQQGWLKHLDFIVLDVLSGQLAFIVAYLAAYQWRYGLNDGLYGDAIYRNLAVWMALFSVVAAVLFDTMHDVLKRSWTGELRQTLAQSLLVFGMAVVYLFSIRNSIEYSRLVLWLTLALYILFAFALRQAWKWLLTRRKRSEQKRAMLLVADEASVAETIRRFEAHPLENIALCGIVLADRDATGERIMGIPVVASLEGAAHYICREWIDEVYIGVSEGRQTPYDLMDKCRQMGVTTHLPVVLPGAGRQTVEKIAGMPMVTSGISAPAPGLLLVKRLADLLGGLLLSLAALLAMLVLGPMLRREADGPILTRAPRIGRSGKRFHLYGLGGASGSGSGGVGAFARRHGIDRWPQGFNVLLGQMSLVGTRPPTAEDWERQELYYRARLAIRPGVTGLWRVEGPGDAADFAETAPLDTTYMENWGLGLDATILLKTLGRSIRGGSEGRTDAWRS